jgi:hypothetical protein
MPMNRTVIPAVALLCVLTPRPVYAYIDPSTGGILAQLITGGIAGLLVLGRLYWRRIRDLFSFSKRPPPSTNPQK